MSQLTKRLYKFGSQAEKEHDYTYDLAGNRTQFTHDFGTQRVEYSQDSDQERLMYESVKKGDADWIEYSHDQNGNRIKAYTYQPDGTIASKRDYIWNPLNQLVQIKQDDKLLQTNHYDLTNGLRYARHTEGKITHYVYDDKERLLSEITPEGIFATIYLGSTKIGRIKISGASTETPEATWYHNDVLGTPVKMSFAAFDGTLVNNSYYLDPWGNYERTVESTSNVQAVQYTGKQLDEDAYLFYFNARYYDPALGRFVGEDKVQKDPNNPNSFNSFMYCRNNPLLFVDADGNLSEQGTAVFSEQMGTAYQGIPYKSTLLPEYTDLSKLPEHLDCISAIGRTFMDLNKSGELKTKLGQNWEPLMEKYGNTVKGFYNLANSTEGKSLGLEVIAPKDVKKGDFILQGDFKHIEFIRATRIENGVSLLKDIAASHGFNGIGERAYLNPYSKDNNYIGGANAIFIRFNDK